MHGTRFDASTRVAQSVGPWEYVLDVSREEELVLKLDDGADRQSPTVVGELSSLTSRFKSSPCSVPQPQIAPVQADS